MRLYLTRAHEYAMRAMLQIASRPEGVHVLCGEIVQAEGIPRSFMAKVLGQLVRANLLSSSRGVHGGFALARPAAEISMLDIARAMQKRPATGGKLLGEVAVSAAADCPAELVWREVQASIEQTLEDFSLEDLTSARRRDGRVVSLSTRRRLRPASVGEATT
jgi:Rrf2 family protein